MTNLTKILCAVDFSATSRRALEYATALSQKFSAELVLLHVLEQVPLLSAYTGRPEIGELRSKQEAVKSQLAAWLEGAGAGGAGARLEVARGATVETILRFCEEFKPDVLVMGTHGRRSLDAALFGSTTYRVIRRAPCPVFVVRLPRDAAAHEPPRK